MARFNGGYIKLHRSTDQSDLGQNETLFALWVRLLLMATWQESKIVWQGRQRVLPPGSVVFGISELAGKWECSRNTISRWLNYLVTSERIVLERSNHGCIATVINWHTYQSNDEDVSATSRAKSKQPTKQPGGIGMSNQVALNEEEKNIRKKELIYTPEFESLWSNYPKRVKKADAFKVYEKTILPDEVPLVTLAIQNYRKYLADTKAEAKFIQHMTTFLNEERWREWLGNVIDDLGGSKNGLQTWLDQQQGAV